MKTAVATRFLLILLLLCQPLAASERSGVVVRSASVFDGPGIDARAVGKLEAGTRVSIFSRRGGWKEIFADDAAVVGWVRAYQVREGDYAPPAAVETEADERGFLSGLASFSRKASRFFGGGGASTSEGTATIGVRGLSEEQLQAAQPDFDQFARMQQFASTPERLARFKRNGRLRKQDVEHLQPQPQQQPAAGQGGRDK